MLDGESRAEVEQIVEDRVRPLEHSHEHLRRNHLSLKRDLADLHAGLTELRTDQAHAHRATIDALRDVRSLQRGCSLEIAELRADVDHVSSSVHGRLDAMDGRLDAMDGRFDAMDGRLDAMDGRLDGMDGRLGEILELLRAA